MLWLKIRDSDAVRQALRFELLKLLPEGLQVLVLHGVVNEEQVDVIELELPQGLFERVFCRLACGNAGELRGDVQLGARDAGLLNALADALFVAVHLSGVDVSEAGVDGGDDGLGGILSVQRGSGPVGDERHGGAVVELDGGHGARRSRGRVAVSAKGGGERVEVKVGVRVVVVVDGAPCERLACESIYAS